MKNTRYALILVFLVLTLTASGLPVNANAQAPGTEGEITAQPDSPGFHPRQGTYSYSFEFNSITIGTAQIHIQQEGELYKMVVSAKTTDTVDRVYKIRYQGENLTGLDPIVPVETTIHQRVKSTLREYVIRFLDNGVISSSEKKLKKGRVINDETRQLHAERFTADPFSATYLARSLEWREGLEQVFEIFTGKRCYELHLTCRGKTTIQTLGENREAWVIVPTVHSMEASEESPDSGDTRADVKIYLSADELKDVLRIEARHTLGTLLVLLDRFDPPAD